MPSNAAICGSAVAATSAAAAAAAAGAVPLLSFTLAGSVKRGRLKWRIQSWGPSPAAVLLARASCCARSACASASPALWQAVRLFQVWCCTQQYCGWRARLQAGG